MRRKKSKELWSDPEYRRINTENKKGKKQSEETIQKRKTHTDYKAIGEKNKGRTPPNKGEKASEEQKQKLKDAWILRKQKYPVVSDITRQKLRKVTAYDLLENKFIKLSKEDYINNTERYCGTTSSRIPKH